MLLITNAQSFETTVAKISESDIARIAEETINPIASKKNKVEVIQTSENNSIRITNQGATPSSQATSKSSKSRLPAQARIYTIQLASYQHQHEALSKVSELSSHGSPVFLSSASVKGRIWYRVNFGRYTSKRRALNDLKNLDEYFQKVAFVQPLPNSK
ncbi:MAG: SPOR domain-containing protein [Bdellovibrionales bacterium]|nr:SPOR domain-containing protein [Bdellovibrionales bacterium]